MGWLLRILLLIVIIRALWRLIRGIIQGASEPPRRAVREGVQLVRDPVCGTFVVPERAVGLGSGRAARYFCSERCRQTYLEGGR